MGHFNSHLISALRVRRPLGQGNTSQRQSFAASFVFDTVETQIQVGTIIINPSATEFGGGFEPTTSALRIRRLKRLLRRRSAIEPVIGHLKQDHRMKRNYLQGKNGDLHQRPVSGLWL